MARRGRRRSPKVSTHDANGGGLVRRSEHAQQQIQDAGARRAEHAAIVASRSTYGGVVLDAARRCSPCHHGRRRWGSRSLRHEEQRQAHGASRKNASRALVETRRNCSKRFGRNSVCRAGDGKTAKSPAADRAHDATGREHRPPYLVWQLNLGIRLTGPNDSRRLGLQEPARPILLRRAAVWPVHPAAGGQGMIVRETQGRPQSPLSRSRFPTV